MAGGLTQKAAHNKIEIFQYFIKDGIRSKKLITHNEDIKKLYKMILRKDDEVRIFKIPNWDERKVVEILGEVKYPGTYVINKGERLFDVIKRAGGFTKNAFIKGAVFTRESLKLRQQKNFKNRSLD